jgi:hypothetical protein
LQVEKLKSNTWEVGKLVGASIYLGQLTRLVAGEPIEKVEAISTMKMTVDAFIDYLKHNTLASKCPSAALFSAELRKIIT